MARLTVLVLVLVFVGSSECVSCFARYDPVSARCQEELGDVDLHQCCKNPKYGHQDQDGVCRACGPPLWSTWSPWSPCTTLCGEGVRQRKRTCYGRGQCENPTVNLETEPCNGTCCDVDGGWGSWSPFSPCPVTCGVGLQMSIRRCDSPAFKHGGRPCAGDERRTMICQADAHCPVDGVWSEWSEWGPCRRSGKSVQCRQLGGTQTQHRRCLHHDHNGNICTRDHASDHHGNHNRRSDGLTRTRVCYDINDCKFIGQWDGWSSWSLCCPPCSSPGQQAPTRFRRQRCEPDYSDYSPTIGRLGDRASFFGTPVVQCGSTPDGQKEDSEVQTCINVPPCTSNTTACPVDVLL